jgi:hypothetical protein
MISLFHPAILWSLLLAAVPVSVPRPPALRILQAPTRLSLPGQEASGPYLTTDPKGHVLVSWVQAQAPGRYQLYYARSADGLTFTAPAAISTTGKVYTHEENLSKIACKPNGDMLAIFSASNPSEHNHYAGMLYYTQSFDEGKHWTEPRQLSPAGRASMDERYFDLAVLPDGEVGAVWLDARKDSLREGSSLYLARTEGRKGFVREQRIGSGLCQCCRTRLVVDARKQVHVTYRAILSDSIRDMAHQLSTDGGNTFSAPRRISADNWVIRGCPHTGPAMMAGSDRLHFAWHTQGGGPGLYYTQSGDGGTRFAARAAVSGTASAKHPQLSLLADGSVVIVWDERYEQGPAKGFRIGLQHRDQEGKVLHTQFLTPGQGSATHPVIVTTKANQLLIAYTQHGETQDEVYYQAVALPQE